MLSVKVAQSQGVAVNAVDGRRWDGHPRLEQGRHSPSSTTWSKQEGKHPVSARYPGRKEPSEHSSDGSRTGMQHEKAQHASDIINVQRGSGMVLKSSKFFELELFIWCIAGYVGPGFKFHLIDSKKHRRGRGNPNSFYEASVTLIPKQREYKTKKKTRILMNIDAKTQQNIIK